MPILARLERVVGAMVYRRSRGMDRDMLIKDQARMRAAVVAHENWDGTFPVDPMRIAMRMGISVYRSDLDFNISGFIIKRSALPAEIYLNINQSPLRQNFTCAHELGHYVERMDSHDEEYSFEDHREGQEWTPREFFANEFAGNLLMPSRRVDELSERGWSAAQMADYFLVSFDAINTRLSKLRLTA